MSSSSSALSVLSSSSSSSSSSSPLSILSSFSSSSSSSALQTQTLTTPTAKGSKVTEVVLIAHYMSGDRYTLASALALNSNVLVAVVGPKDASTELYEYFRSKLDDQALLLLTESRNDAEKILGFTKRPQDYRQELQEISTRLGLGHRTVNFHAPAFGTGVVADAFSKKLEGSRSVLSLFWSISEQGKRFADFLNYKGFIPGQRYAFLWCKKGTITGEKAHHYTDRRSWAMLAAHLATKTNFFPVFTGDDIGLSTEPNLTEFWKDWQELYNEQMSRNMQLGLWAYIVRTRGRYCCAIGMRSGMLEVPALLGIRTLYLEEVENAQRARMAQWLTKVDTWYRGVMFRPWGTMQNVYWSSLMVKHESYPSVTKRMRSHPSTIQSGETSRTRYLVSVALLYLRHRDEGAYRAAKKLVLEYLGYDIDDPERAITQDAVMSIVGWVNRRISGTLKTDKLAEKVITEALSLAIEGGLAPPEEKVSQKPSSEELAILRQQKEAGGKKPKRKALRKQEALSKKALS